MAVLKFLVSAALLGTVAHCQDLYSPYLRSGTSGAQYSPAALGRGTPRLVPVKVRSSASRLFPSYYYPALPPPPLYARHQALNHRPYNSNSNTNSYHQQPTFPRFHQQYRPAMTGYYRPTRQSFYGGPYRQNGQNLAYNTAATSSPIVLKRGRVLQSSSSQAPYSLGATSQSLGLSQQSFGGLLGGQGSQSYGSQSLGGQGSQSYGSQSLGGQGSQSYGSQSLGGQGSQSYGGSQSLGGQSSQSYGGLSSQSYGGLGSLSQSGLQYNPQNIQGVSTYRPAPPPQPQPAAAPQPQISTPQQFLPYQPQQQPNFYIQKSPVVAGPGSPRKVLKAKKPAPRPTPESADAEEEEEYPGDPNPQYNFSFDIKDDELTNYQNRQEERDGQTIKGSYSVVDPDGYVRTVTYTADPKNGFQAKVTREPTDVKIKFPVPTEPPPTEQEGVKSAGPARRGQSYASPQAQYQQQPQQYQTAAYATPQQVYTSTAGEAGLVQPQSQYVQRATSRFAIQPQASTQPRITSRSRYTQQEE